MTQKLTNFKHEANTQAELIKKTKKIKIISLCIIAI
jgi:hypothetical protein